MAIFALPPECSFKINQFTYYIYEQFFVLRLRRTTELHLSHVHSMYIHCFIAILGSLLPDWAFESVAYCWYVHLHITYPIYDIYISKCTVSHNKCHSCILHMQYASSICISSWIFILSYSIDAYTHVHIHMYIFVWHFRVLLFFMNLDPFLFIDTLFFEFRLIVCRCATCVYLSFVCVFHTHMHVCQTLWFLSHRDEYKFRIETNEHRTQTHDWYCNCQFIHDCFFMYMMYSYYTCRTHETSKHTFSIRPCLPHTLNACVFHTHPLLFLEVHVILWQIQG